MTFTSIWLLIDKMSINGHFLSPYCVRKWNNQAFKPYESFHPYSYDIIIDNNLKPWLIEVGVSLLDHMMMVGQRLTPPHHCPTLPVMTEQWRCLWYMTHWEWWSLHLEYQSEHCLKILQMPCYDVVHCTNCLFMYLAPISLFICYNFCYSVKWNKCPSPDVFGCYDILWVTMSTLHCYSVVTIVTMRNKQWPRLELN